MLVLWIMSWTATHASSVVSQVIGKFGAAGLCIEEQRVNLLVWRRASLHQTWCVCFNLVIFQKWHVLIGHISHLKLALLNHQSSMSSLIIAFPQNNPTQLFIGETSASVTTPFFYAGTASQLRMCTPLHSHNFNFFQHDCLHLQSFIAAALTTWSFTSRPLVLARDWRRSQPGMGSFWESAASTNGAGPKRIAPSYWTYKPLHQKLPLWIHWKCP